MEREANIIDFKNEYLIKLSEADVDEGLIRWLESSGFFTSPATTKYHHNFEGGLCLHSLQVANLMVRFSKLFGVNISEKSLLRVGLLHEISKSDYFELSASNKKVYSPDGDKYDDLGRFYWQSELGYKVKDKSSRVVVGNTGFHSYMVSKEWVKYTDDEIIALCNYSNISNSDSSPEVLSILSNCKLMLLLHLADMASSYLNRSYYDISF